MLTDEHIVTAGYMHTVETDEPLFTFDRKELIAMVRELLSASKPAAPADAQRMMKLCALLDRMDEEGNGFPSAIHEAFQNGGAATRAALDAYEIDGFAPAAPAQSGKPVAWVRYRSDGGFEGPIMDSDARMCDTRRGFWTPLYTDPQLSQPAKAGDDDVRERIARALHYPACWDTAAYPTLESAAWEAIACAKLGCSACEPAQSAVVLDDEQAKFLSALAKHDPRPYTPRAYSEQVWFRRGWDGRAASPQATEDTPATLARDAVRMLEGYAESYDSMAKMDDAQGNGTVQCRSVARDIRANMAGWFGAYLIEQATATHPAQTERALTDEQKRQREQLNLIAICKPDLLLTHIEEDTNYDAKLLARVFELAKERAIALLAAQPDLGGDRG